MINLLLFSFFIFFILIIKNLLGNKILATDKTRNVMIRCSVCETYVEASTASKIDEKWICSKERCN